MDFAKSILSKYGWQDGDGLGKDKQGIKKAIKANLKFDQAGLGATQTSELGNNWWERCFNDAAQNVTVQKEQNGNIIIDLKDAENSVEVSTKGYSVKKLKESGNGVYGNNFLSSNVAVSTFAMTKYKVLTDEELFKACGGRTAHKGARHGLKQSGKLARIEQQEKELLAKMKKKELDKSETCTENVKIEKVRIESDGGEKIYTKKKRSEVKDEENKLRKKRKDDFNIMEQVADTFDVEKTSETESIKAPKKKKRKNVEHIEEMGAPSPNECIKSTDETHKNKKRPKEKVEISKHSERDCDKTQRKKKKQRKNEI